MKIDNTGMDDPFEVNHENVLPYFAGKKKSKHYYKAKDYYYHMAFHADGYFLHMPGSEERAAPQYNQAENDNKDLNPYFSRLIDSRRPSESDSILAYRRVVYRPLTQGVWFKVYNSLRKIVKSPDFKIDYAKADHPSKVPDGEDLEEYCEKKYPVFNSVENWFYNYGLKQMLVDSNAVIYVLPRRFDIEENELYEPVATTVLCKDVFEYKEDEVFIWKVDRKYEYDVRVNGSGAKFKRKGLLLGILTKEGYWEARQINGKMDFDLIQVMEFQEPLKFLPAWHTGGVQKHMSLDSILYKSFMDPMLPGLDEMASDSSELSAEKIQHVYSTMWYFSQQDCRVCMGSGRMNSKGKQSITCSACNGTGTAPKSPYRDMVIKADSLTTSDGGKIPTPPAGYITKDTAIVDKIMQMMEKNEYRALSSVNHEFLTSTPANESGKAKEYDRQELNNYTYSIAYRMVEIMEEVYYFINEFRYMTLVPNELDRVKMLPKIPVPVNYDLVTGSAVEQKLKAAMDAKADPEIIDQLELEYISKEFPNESKLKEIIIAKKRLDPFPRMTVEEKQNLILSNVAEPVDVILSIYLHPFIERAFFEHPDDAEGKAGFCEMELDKQKEILLAYAQEKVDKLDAAKKLKDKAAAKKAAAKATKIDPKTGKPMPIDPNDPEPDPAAE